MTHRIKNMSVRALILITLILVAAYGCARPTAHQKGGKIAQSLGEPAYSDVLPRPAVAPAVPSQSLVQPENPAGESRQSISETTTTTKPDGTVVTTVKKADSVIGGSQDLADIIGAYMKGEYMRRLMIALGLAVLAWKLKEEWPVVAVILGSGAAAVVILGEIWTLVAACLAGGVFIAYHALKPRLPIP